MILPYQVQMEQFFFTFNFKGALREEWWRWRGKRPVASDMAPGMVTSLSFLSFSPSYFV